MSDTDERQRFRDMLIEVHTMMKAHLEDYVQHKKDDKEHFQRLYTITGDLKKLVWMMVGGLVVLEVVIKLFK